MKVTFIGGGYVGLVYSIMSAYSGHEVVCLDKDEGKIKLLRESVIPIYEPGLSEYASSVLKEGRIKFLRSYDSSISSSDLFFICVGTPSLPGKGLNLEYIYEALENLLPFLSEGSIIVVKSTVPPGTCDSLKAFLKSAGKECSVISNPEFLREGKAVRDFLNPDRVIIGTRDEKAGKALSDFYRYGKEKNIQIIYTDAVTAELTKYASNAFLAAKVGFINEIADLCEVLGADVKDVSKGMGADPRIGPEFLNPGPGFGGSCFPKDISALAFLAREKGLKSSITEAVIKSNEERAKNLAGKIIKILERNSVKPEEAAVSFFGLSFKAGTDDLRSSPALEIIKILKERVQTIAAYDPALKDKTAPLPLGILNLSSPEGARGYSDAFVIATEWEEFKNLDFSLLSGSGGSKIIIDLRSVTDRAKWRAEGFDYYSIGAVDGA